MVEIAAKLEEIELWLADGESLNSVKYKEIIELKVTLEACEDKWYNAGFANVKKSVEPIMFQSRKYGFSEGWMAALVAAGVLEDSPLKNPDQVPYTMLPAAFCNTKSPATKSLICTPLLYCQASFFW